MSDDDLRRWLREYASAEPMGEPDIARIVERSMRTRRRTGWILAAAAAVVFALVAGSVAVIAPTFTVASSKPRPPAPERPLPTEVPPMPSPTPVPFPYTGARSEYADQGPIGNVGDVIAGLRLDSVTFATTTCDTGQECPEYAVLKVTNVTDRPIQRQFGMSIWQGRFVSGSMGAAADLAPFQTKSVTVDFMPWVNENATAQPNEPFAWQWYVIDPNR